MAYGIAHIFVNVKYVSQIIRRKPRFLFRLVSNYVCYLLRPNRPPLRFVDIAITYLCTMRCSHCSALQMARADRQPLTVTDYQAIADKLLKSGVLVVNLTGGEPMVRKDIYEIIAAFKPRQTMIALQTNGSLLDEKELLKLRKAGVDAIDVSIDGADAATHDAFRKSPGAFEKACAVLAMGRRMGFHVGISYVLTRDNLYSKDRVAVEELSRKYRAMLNYNLAVPIGYWRGKTDNLIRPEDRRYLNELMDKYPMSKTDFETTYYRRGCAAIKEKLYINAYGEVMPCPFIQVSFGNIVRDGVEEIRDRALGYPYFKEYASCCLAAEDPAFIANVRCYAADVDAGRLPVPYTEAFVDGGKGR